MTANENDGQMLMKATDILYTAGKCKITRDEKY